MEDNSKIANLLKLIGMLEARLSGKGQTKDVLGNYIDSPIFPTEKLMIFLEMSLSDFNQVPIFSNFTFSDSDFVDCFSSVLVEGATIYALGSQALLEKGREFSINQIGSSYDPPDISNMLNEQYSQLYSLHWEKLKYIKKDIKDFGK